VLLVLGEVLDELELVLGVVLESVVSLERDVSVESELPVDLLAFVVSARPAEPVVEALVLVEPVVLVVSVAAAVELGLVLVLKLGLVVSVAAVLVFEVGLVELVVVSDDVLGVVVLLLYVEPL
jgi:hypothetical protein